MKRITRQRTEETKQKISEALKGKAKTERHRKAISIALKRYWATIPNDNNKDYIWNNLIIR